MVAYFVNQRAGDANRALTTQQIAAQQQQNVQAAQTSSNAAAYAAYTAAVDAADGYSPPQGPTGGSSSSGSTAEDQLEGPVRRGRLCEDQLEGPVRKGQRDRPVRKGNGVAYRWAFEPRFADHIDAPIPFGGARSTPSGAQIGGPMYGGLGSNANLATPSGTGPRWVAIIRQCMAHPQGRRLFPTRTLARARTQCTWPDRAHPMNWEPLTYSRVKNGWRPVRISCQIIECL
jgi:hypothetical protein